MSTPGSVDISQVIELAIAPVFLLTAVGATLSVLASRLARVVDRGRAVASGAAYPEGEDPEEELRRIEDRARWILRGLSLATVCGIFVSLVIAVAFLGYVVGISLGGYVAALFVAAMAAYTGALLCLLREVFLAARMFRLTPARSSPDRGQITASAREGRPQD